MRIFEIIKENVNLREAAERYGVEVNHYGMALCPFHNDRYPSLYVADDHYHCFACGEHGDVMTLWEYSPRPCSLTCKTEKRHSRSYAVSRKHSYAVL